MRTSVSRSPANSISVYTDSTTGALDPELMMRRMMSRSVSRQARTTIRRLSEVVTRSTLS